MTGRVLEMPRKRHRQAGRRQRKGVLVEMPVLAPINWVEIAELENHVRSVHIATNRAIEVGRDLLARLNAGLPVQPYSEETLQQTLQRLTDVIDQAKQLDKAVPRIESLAKHF